jgi:hypothetical protein
MLQASMLPDIGAPHLFCNRYVYGLSKIPLRLEHQKKQGSLKLCISRGIDSGALQYAGMLSSGWGPGGNLAAVTAVQARDHGSPPLVYQLLIYPAVDAPEIDGEFLYESYNGGDFSCWYLVDSAFVADTCLPAPSYPVVLS